MGELLTGRIEPDAQGLVDCILRRGEPKRVHHIELFLDKEIQDKIVDRFDLCRDLAENDPFFEQKRQITLQRFLGYDYVRCGLDDWDMPLTRETIEDTAGLARAAGRRYMEEHKGPITSWKEFEEYPWPKPGQASTRSLDWYEANLPDDMCLIGSGGFAHYAEYLTWLMGYESLCYALFDNKDLVDAIRNRLMEIYEGVMHRLLEYSRISIYWGSDDMGFRSGTLISPDDLREYVFPGHRQMARMAHDAGKPYILHACGKLDMVMKDLIEDVKIDGKHSFEDTIEKVTDAHESYGDKIALLGGIDVDFLCRSDEEAIRRRVRETLDECQPGGGYCLGTGNSVANYIPVDNYLIMLDEGRKY